MIVTSLGLPYEIYDLTDKITVTRIIFFLINLALVVYLVVTRRLFGVRGGKAAYEARLRSESVIQEARNAIAAAASRTPPRPLRPARSRPGHRRQRPGRSRRTTAPEAQPLTSSSAAV